MARKNIRRENFDLTPEQQAEIESLQSLLNASTKKEAVLFAVHLTLQIAAEAKKGNQFFIGLPGEALQRLVLLDIQKPELEEWKHLIKYAHPWKKQLYVKGRKLPASVIWNEMSVNQLTVEDAMENWDLPREAILEALQYCETNRILLVMEAAEEERLLRDKGIAISRPSASS